jgi:uncharacterized protein (UPF0332 family)
MTEYSELLDQGSVKRGRFARRQVDDCLRIAHRDLETAKVVIENSADWAFNIAYNAMYQAGRSFMFHCGYRATGHSHHATVVRFLEIGLGSEYKEMLALMDRMRRKRNRATYDTVGTISNKEAEDAMSTAREFVARLERLVRRKKK